MKIPKSKSSFQTAPEGTTKAVVVDVVDLGMLPDKFSEEEKLIPMVKLVFQTEEQTEEGKPFVVGTYPLKASLNSRANFYKLVAKILGRDLTDDDYDEEGDADVDTLLLGKNVNVTIQHATKGDKTYANVVDVSPLIKSQLKEEALVAVDYVRQKDRESFNPEDFDEDED